MKFLAYVNDLIHALQSVSELQRDIDCLNVTFSLKIGSWLKGLKKCNVVVRQLRSHVFNRKNLAVRSWLYTRQYSGQRSYNGSELSRLWASGTRFGCVCT